LTRVLPINTSLISLDFRYNQLTPPQIREITQALRQNFCIEEFLIEEDYHHVPFMVFQSDSFATSVTCSSLNTGQRDVPYDVFGSGDLKSYQARIKKLTHENKKLKKVGVVTIFIPSHVFSFLKRMHKMDVRN